MTSNEKHEIIRLENVTFTYATASEQENDQTVSKDVVGVANVSLSINEGEFVALIGRNGSGKSTLAKLLNGLFLPNSGTVEVYGMDTSDKKTIFKIRESVGMVFQNPDNQMIASIVEDDIAFGPENIGIERQEIIERVDWALKSVGMLDYAKKAPHKLSGGQKQRIAIAGVLALRPKVLILDEATAMLDPQGRKEVIETAKRLQQEENITVILITHHMDEIINASRVIVLESGKIILSGTPQEIFKEKYRLEKAGLAVPVANELAYELNERRLDVNKGILTIDELGDELCQLL